MSLRLSLGEGGKGRDSEAWEGKGRVQEGKGEAKMSKRWQGKGKHVKGKKEEGESLC